MFRIKFKDFSGCEHQYDYSSTNSIEEIQEEFNRISRIHGNTDVNVFEVEEFNITGTMLNPKKRFTHIKDKIENIRQMLIYFRNLASSYKLNLVKGKPETDMANICDCSETSLMMLNDINRDGNVVWDEGEE